MFGHAPDIGLPYDLDKARWLLSQAGYPEGRGFPPVRGIMYEAYAPLNSHIQDQWRTTLGIDVPWELLSWQEFQNQSRHETPDLVFSGWVADYPDPDNILRIATHTSRSGWGNERFAQLVDQARNLSDPSARGGLYQEADRILIDQVGLIPISYGRWHLLVKPRIQRFPASPLKYTFWKDIILKPPLP
jgi:oligopeptide transport system substrate-binding protein